MSSSSTAVTKRPSSTNVVNCEKAGRGVWLVKVPRYLSEIWEKNAGNDVGRIVTGLGESGRDVIFKSTTQMPSVSVQMRPTAAAGGGRSGFASFGAQTQRPAPQPINISRSTVHGMPRHSLRAAAADPQPLGRPTQKAAEIPTEHTFIMRDLNNQTMAVLCEDKGGLEEESSMRTGKLSIEGRVMKKAECQPPNSKAYMQMKIRQIEENRQPKKLIKQIDRAVVKYKPTTVHHEHLSKAKKEGTKFVRGERADVMQAIFHAFEKHQYYRLADLQHITQQPTNFVKEILLDIANYNTTPPYKSMWELKPEYRNYKAQTAASVEEDDDED